MMELSRIFYYILSQIINFWNVDIKRKYNVIIFKKLVYVRIDISNFKLTQREALNIYLFIYLKV